ncbi:MAG: spermidine/putrescine ABC transporter substrate-binding protein [Clostridia bacterium]|nr:spermidine/putrescine ABC transporter substrate-binding protein [Clostridia bacterium]MBR4034876.1 spermidine/putrescine ABC transporter substrate-binding protein [Clostridia bacterium]
MKKIVLSLLLTLLCLSALLLFSSCDSSGENVLNVYNWGEYISDGSEGSLDVIAAFEDWYYEAYGETVTVNYTTFSSNEDLYNKLASGATGYDIIIPSDYMIARMIEEDMLLELDFSKIYNYKYILDDFKGLYYDPEEKYTVPYTYGTLGIIYNTDYVDEADAREGWDLLWNEKYSGNILQYNNSRDAFGTAMYRFGIDVNTTAEADWNRVYESLSAQKPLIQSYVMDEIYNKMESGEAYISSYYAGDYLFMYQNNESLAFLQPDVTNFFIDAMCIPKTAQNPELANIFINFMLSEEIAIANAEMICYASPNRLVIENEEYLAYLSDIKEDAVEILYPEGLDFKAKFEQYAYRSLDVETNALMTSLWSKLKIGSDEGVSAVYIVALFEVILIVCIILFFRIRKKRRERYY